MKTQILDTITIQDVLQKYGYDIGRGGRCKCAIHHGKDNNFSYNNKLFQCWVCGAKGNVISLVMQLFNIDFKSALIRINYDFGLGLSNEKPNMRERQKIAEMQREKERRKHKEIEEEKRYLELVKYRHKLWAENKPTEWIDKILDDPEERRNYEYYTQRLPTGSIEYYR